MPVRPPFVLFLTDSDLTSFSETMQWFHPETTGDAPPPCRAHSATAVGHRIFVFGGGQDLEYYNHLYVLDTYARKWTRIDYPADAVLPIPRRAHTTWVYQGRLYMFGGGNGSKALNDVWALNVNAPYEEMGWECLDIKGTRKPGARGYHSANLVKDVVVVIGGSDGTYVFDDVWVLHLGRMQWYPIEVDIPKRLLGHTATQVGSYLFIIGGHNGTDYSSELELFNLGTFRLPTLFFPLFFSLHQLTSIGNPAPRVDAPRAYGGTTAPFCMTRGYL